MFSWTTTGNKSKLLILRTCVVLFWTVNSRDSNSTSPELIQAAGRRNSGGNMFNLYSSMNRRGEGQEKPEIQTTGHDRFYQSERSR